MAAMAIYDLDFSNSSTTTTTTVTTDDSAWNDWSPLVDWDAFSGADQDDFRGLMDSMLIDADEDPSAVDDDLSDTTTPATAPEDDEDSKGLRLVHLLMAAAESLTGSNPNRDLARVILVRLKELVSPTHGTNMERLAAYFTEALQSLLDGAGVHNKHSGNHRDDPVVHHHHHHHHQGLNQADVLAAFQLLQDMSPYVKFGHFTANQAIIEAVAHDRRVHIIDYDIMEGVQWASLIQSLSTRNNGPPAPHLRITALSRGGSLRKSFGSVQETGRRLAAFAASLGQPFSFHQCRLDPDETFRATSLKLVKGEALIVNCMLHFPHSSHCGSRAVLSFLSGARELSPRLVTLVEEEVSQVGDTGFVGRFMDSLHHYSAVYDSLEAGFPMQNRATALVEKVVLGPRIVKSLARIYRARGEEGEGGSWGEWMSRVGFYPVGLSFSNHCQAKLLLGLFNDGYRVEELGCNRIALGWKSRRLLSASVWAPVGPIDSDLSN